jgi:hypothetical protein
MEIYAVNLSLKSTGIIFFVVGLIAISRTFRSAKGDGFSRRCDATDGLQIVFVFIFFCP